VAAIKILVGTMTGTAELVADEIRDELAKLGHEGDILPMDDLDADVFGPAANVVYLICMSTYGQGDVPDNAMGLFNDLEARRPDLSAVRFGVVALGDRTYADTFCDGGHRFDALLRELGGQRIGDAMEHDASDGSIPEEVAIEWSRNWLRLVEAHEEAA
jgi:MioC protein